MKGEEYMKQLEEEIKELKSELTELREFKARQEDQFDCACAWIAGSTGNDGYKRFKKHMAEIGYSLDTEEDRNA